MPGRGRAGFLALGLILAVAALVTLAAGARQAAASTESWCTTRDFQIREASAQGALGTLMVELSYRNITHRACLTGGFPGVTLWGVDGRKLGVARRMDVPRHLSVLNVQPGARVFDVIGIDDTDDSTRRSCPAVRATSIYAPDSTQSSTVKLPAWFTDCGGAPEVFAMQPSAHGLG